MKRTIVILFVIFLSTSLMSWSSENPLTPGSENYLKIKRVMDSVRVALEDTLNKTVPSLNILVHTPNDYIFVSSVPSGGTPLTLNTNFRFASNTKNFTSTCILKMYQDGWLDLYANIIDIMPGSSEPYIPNTPGWNVPYKDQITIEQLLQHSAGVYDVDNDPVPGYYGRSYTDYVKAHDPWYQFTSEELVSKAAENNLSYFAPGTGYHYSNTGYTILGEIIARVYSFRSGSPKTLTDYLNDHIIGGTAPVPINVHFPYLATDSQLPSPYTVGTTIDSSGNTRISDQANMSAHVAEGNGYGTFAELDKYVRSLMKGQNVLTPASVQLMQNSGSSVNPNYALGCFRIPNLGYGHNGEINGYLSYMLYNPDTDVSVIIMLPFIDFSGGAETFLPNFMALTDAGFAVMEVLGYPGHP